jgi:hypothetical protein
VNHLLVVAGVVGLVITRSQRIPRDRERQEFDMSDTLEWNAKTRPPDLRTRYGPAAHKET